MDMRTYGSTGIEVSGIGFGGMRFENYDDPEACAALVKAAYEAGITYFDTAPGYAGGKSEEVMGLAFAEMNKTRAERPFYVATKSSKAMPGDVRQDLEASLKRLQVEHIDFYHVWCVIDQGVWTQRKTAGALRAFEKAKDEGLIKHICISSHMTGSEIGEVLQEYPFDGVLLGYSAMNFAYREAALEAAAKLGRGVVVMNPLGGGLIPQHPDRFGFLKTRDDETVVQGALRFLLNDDRITTALVGFSNLQHLQEALAAVDGFQPLSRETVNRIRGELKGAFNELCTGCRYCDVCPRGIPVPKYMEAYNHYKLSGKVQDIFNRMRWHWGLALEDDYLARCTECGACEKACTQRLPICERLQTIKAEAERQLAEKKG